MREVRYRATWRVIDCMNFSIPGIRYVAMSMQSKRPASSDVRDAAARATLVSRVQEQLSARGRSAERRCPLCGETIRGGQASTTVHGTTVHARCRSASRRIL